MDPGKRDRFITIKEATTTTNDYGEEIASGETTLATGWAQVKFGPAGEKREAAQEGALQAATFELVSTEALRAVPMTAFIEFDGSEWDITEKAPLDRMAIRFTAVRSR